MVPVWRAMAGDVVAIFMLHRFEDREEGVAGHSLDGLRANLEFLRRHRVRVASLQDLMDGVERDRRTRGPTVVFTVDDGYYDFAERAAPIFLEYDCPVTVFLVTGAVDGTLWFWWDKVQHCVEGTQHRSVTLELSTGARTWDMGADAPRWVIIEQIVEALKLVPDAEREEALVALARRLEVDVPITPPKRFSAMTWASVRGLSYRGVSFGPHSVTHPMLTQVDAPRAEREIHDSWVQVRDACPAVVPVFCYPSGGYVEPHLGVLSDAGIHGAVTTEPHYMRASAFASRDPAVRFGVPRFAYNDDPVSFVQIVSGAERVKMGARRGSAGWRVLQ